MAVTILPTFNRTHLPFFKGVFLISGVFAYDLILLMLVPPFGWFVFTICASVMALLLYRSRRQILRCCQEIIESVWHSTSEAIHCLCDWFRQSLQLVQRCQEILEPMWHSTSEAFHSLCDWFRQSFQSVWTAPSQASTESSMPISNMTEKHVVGSENNV